MPLSPTQLSLRYLRSAGYSVAKAEYWFQAPGMKHGRRRDLFGFIDVCAAGHGELLLVQVTSRSNVSGRVRKITGECAEPAWQLLHVPGVHLHVHGWPAGETKRPFIYALSTSDFDQVEQLPF